MNKDEDFSFDVSDDKNMEKKGDKSVGKKIDIESVEERVKRIDEIKGNPPEKGFMKQTLHEAERGGKKFVVIEDEKGDIERNDDEEVVLLDTIMEIDLKTLSDAQFADCASNVIPMLIDQAVNVAVTLKKAFKPELRKEPFNYWWIVMGLLMIPSIILVVLLAMGV